MTRLQNTYGKAAFSTERCTLIWKEVGEIPDHWMSRIVDKFIGDSKQSPMIPDFREEISRYRSWENEKRKNLEQCVRTDEDSEKECNYCFAKGYYFTWKKSAKMFYIFKCHCNYGIKDEKKFPQFREEYRYDYVWISPDSVIKHKKEAEVVSGFPEI